MCQNTWPEGLRRFVSLVYIFYSIISTKIAFEAVSIYRKFCAIRCLQVSVDEKCLIIVKVIYKVTWQLSNFILQDFVKLSQFSGVFGEIMTKNLCFFLYEEC